MIPARGGSKGLPGKNLRPFAGLPLIAHSILCARMCPEIVRCVVSTDDAEIAAEASRYGADLPLMRPAELATDDAPMIPVLQHALAAASADSSPAYEFVLLLDPTSPGRLPSDVAAAARMLREDPLCVGVVGVSEPHFNPRWVCVEPREDGYLKLAFETPTFYVRRQDVPPIYRVNATIYLWRASYLSTAPLSPVSGDARHRMLIVPEERAVHIDTAEDFRMAELFIQSGIVSFPWLDSAGATAP